MAPPPLLPLLAALSMLRGLADAAQSWLQCCANSCCTKRDVMVPWLYLWGGGAAGQYMHV